MAAAVNGTADVWRERVVAQQASGRSIRAWCRAHDCHEHGFYWWRARLGLSPKSGVKRQRRRPAPAAFAEVVFDRSTSDEAMTLRLRGGRELLPASMPVEQLVQFLRAIEGVA